jgi:hypothetical protein
LQQPPPSKFLPTQHSESYLTQHCNLCVLTDAWSNITVVSFLLHDVWCQDIWFICWRMIIVQEKAVCASLHTQLCFELTLLPFMETKFVTETY